ncbi:MAG: hypothetical protein HQL53_11400 [Magnetococcales bacterium]|nr:hypothetical protein [Magnetococcales bacterium]
MMRRMALLVGVLVLSVGWGLEVGAETYAPGGLRVEKKSPKIRFGEPVRSAGGSEVSLDKDQLTVADFWDRIVVLGYEGEGKLLMEAEQGLTQISYNDMVEVSHKHSLKSGDRLLVFRKGAKLKDPESGEDLGQILRHLGELRVERSLPGGALARVERALRPLHPGDMLLPWKRPVRHVPLHAVPRTPVQGRIMKIQNGMEVSARGHMVVVGLGRRHRVAPGLTMAIYRGTTPAKSVAARSRGKAGEQFIKRDGMFDTMRPIGRAVLIHVGEKASFAYIKEAARPVWRDDWLTAP